MEWCKTSFREKANFSQLYRKDSASNWLRYVKRAYFLNIYKLMYTMEYNHSFYSSPCRGSTDDRTIYRPNWCILFLYFGPSHPSLHWNCNLLGRRLRTRKLGSLEECNYMRDRPDGVSIWIAQCYNGYSEIVCLIEKIFFVFYLVQIFRRICNEFFYLIFMS